MIIYAGLRDVGVIKTSEVLIYRIHGNKRFKFNILSPRLKYITSIPKYVRLNWKKLDKNHKFLSSKNLINK